MKARADRRLRAALRACIATALVGACAGDAGALTLGEIELRSALGEALDARIPVVDEGGDTVRAACFSLARAPDGGIPQVPGATLEFRRHPRGAELLVKSRAPVVEPAVGLGIDIACPGTQAAHRADFPILLEPRAAPAGRAKIDAATSLGSLPGDSLAVLAAKIFPADRAARDAYLRAMREANPSLAALADDEALPAATPVALPDLHAFARRHRAAPVKVAAARAPAARIERARPSEPSEAPPAKPAAPPPRAKRDTAPATFELRLSAPVLDLSPSRTMTEAQRAQLRERLLVLEADDRTASLLELRESIRKLESQVAALELKLAQAPAEVPAAPKAVPAPKSVEPASTPAASTPATASPPAPVAASAPVATPAQVAKPAPAPAPEPQKPAVAERPAPVAEPAPPRPKPAPERPKVRANPRPASAAAWYDAPWVLPGALAIVVIALAVLLVRRRRASVPGHEFADTPDLILDEAPADQTVMMDMAADEPPAPLDRTMRFEAAPQGAPATAARIPEEDSAELRRRYIEERFPEIANGALVLDDPASVVKAARLLYEDGAAARAIELLQFAIEQDPGAASLWLALFEVFRIERLRGEFGQLALRFHDRHGSSPEWPRVQRAGREIDPGNAFYGEGDGQRFDAAAENWLQAPAATNDALAAELRGAIMDGASVSERDLTPDPTPALRKAESIRLA